MMDKTVQKFPEQLHTNIYWNPSVLLLDFSDTQYNITWAKWGNFEKWNLWTWKFTKKVYTFCNIYFCVMCWWLFMRSWPHRKVCSGSPSEGTQPTVVGTARRQMCEGTGYRVSTVRNQGDNRECVLAKTTTELQSPPQWSISVRYAPPWRLASAGEEVFRHSDRWAYGRHFTFKLHQTT